MQENVHNIEHPP